jgi:hypothetical protein
MVLYIHDMSLSKHSILTCSCSGPGQDPIREGSMYYYQQNKQVLNNTSNLPRPLSKHNPLLAIKRRSLTLTHTHTLVN